MKNKENSLGGSEACREEKGIPAAFKEKMGRLLGKEADLFFKSYEETRRFGLRINPLKLSGGVPDFLNGLKRIPWSDEGYYYEEELRPGRHPFHEAGLYYIQEPSAQACAQTLAPKPGENILDLCAAPGGKSTHLAGKMEQRGLLVCNEIHPARAKILSQNVERMGIGNAVVTNMEPAGLVPIFPEFFDGIVVDAPCSGEGMFRKDENARAEWSPDHVKLCAARQDGILDCAAEMLKVGGRIVYSTCTFSPEENEQTVTRFLERHPEFYVVRPECAGYFSEGRPQWAAGTEDMRKTVRIWPHKADGEGHFIALLVKGRAGFAGAGANVDCKDRPGGRKKARAEALWGGERQSRRPRAKSQAKNGQCKAGPEEFYEFCKENLTETKRLMDGRSFLLFGDNLYLTPGELPELSGLKVLRPGLHVGTIKKGRLEPSHALALFLKKEEVRRVAEIGTGILAEKYLRGETIPIEEIKGMPGNESLGSGGGEGEPKGWTLITTGGFSLGFAKADRGVLKNHYPKGLRKP